MKTTFDLTVALARIEQAIKPFPKAAMFDLTDRDIYRQFTQMFCLSGSGVLRAGGSYKPPVSYYSLICHS